ncbi:MAG TPA: twin-arginine translocase TatA/TatE family subunit [Verrucomicrobiae bacterium]|jgi:sec-independent protein translocase protein TatA|nr:twin-arginine translocase TatA/TatE family subunit [Verrucomicrobiae bacterium]
MTFHPLFAIDTPIILIIIAGLAVLLFGADRLPKLARSAGQAKKEFLAGQAEADQAEIKAREDARRLAESRQSDLMKNTEVGSMSGETIPPPTPGSGTLSS